jgi:hypothetical protein
VTGDIDSAVERELAQDLALAGAGEGVFVVDAAVGRANQDFPGLNAFSSARFSTPAR